MSEFVFPPNDLDLISYLTAISKTWMRGGIRIPAWYLLPATLGILGRCQSLWELERFAIRNHGVFNYESVANRARDPADSRSHPGLIQSLAQAGLPGLPA